MSVTVAAVVESIQEPDDGEIVVEVVWRHGVICVVGDVSAVSTAAACVDVADVGVGVVAAVALAVIVYGGDDGDVWYVVVAVAFAENANHPS